MRLEDVNHVEKNLLGTAATFATEAGQETLKSQSAPLNCTCEKVHCLLKCKAFGEVLYVGKA